MKVKKITLAITRSLLTFCVIIFSQQSFANDNLKWSGCLSLTSLSNHIAHQSKSVFFTVMPAVANCPNDGHGIRFKIGSLGIDGENIKGFMAMGLGALLAEKKVTFYYDSETCEAQIISIGNYNGQCK